MKKLIESIYFKIQELMEYAHFVKGFFSWKDLVSPVRFREIVKRVTFMLKPLDKDVLTQYFFLQVFGHSTPEMEKFYIGRDGWKGSKAANLLKELLRYVDIRSVNGYVSNTDEECWALVDYGYVIMITTFREGVNKVEKNESDLKRPIFKKLKPFLEEYSFTYLGKIKASVERFMFQDSSGTMLIVGR